MHRRLIPTLALALVLAVATAQAQPRKTYKVHNIDVGQGSATLVQTLGGKNILFDTGWDFAGDRLVSYLRKAKIKRIDALVISHRHMDHIGGVQKLSEAVRVKKVIGPWLKGKIPETAMVHLAHLRSSLSKPHSVKNRPVYETATTGKVFDMGHGFTMETVWPKKHTSGKRIGDYNEESVAMRVVQKSPSGKAASFFFGGDLGVKEERWLARKMPNKLKCDWVVANHHGSAGSSQREFMVAQDGGYSRLLRSLIEGPTTRDKKVYDIATKLKDTGRGKYAGTLMRQLDPLNKKPHTVRSKWLKTLIKDVKDLDASQPSMKGRYAVYSVGKNAYGHPNATRMSEAMLAGFTPITTWNNGTVVMTRQLGRDGGWTRDWKPVAVASSDLPQVKTPGWLGKTDPQKPYNNVRREANYHWSKKNPHKEVSWGSEWDVSKTWRSTSREFSQGRKDWVEEYVLAKAMATNGVGPNGGKPRSAVQKNRNMATGLRKLSSMQHNARTEWHGLKLDSLNDLTKVQLQHVALKADGRYSRRGHAADAPPAPTRNPRRKATKKTTPRKTTAKKATTRKTTAKKATTRKTTSRGRFAKAVASTTRASQTRTRTRTKAKTTRPRTRTRAKTTTPKRTPTRRATNSTKSTSRRRASTKSSSRTRTKTSSRTTTRRSTSTRPRATRSTTSRRRSR